MDRASESAAPPMADLPSSGPVDAVKGKWLIVSGFWIVQAAAGCLLLPMIFDPPSSFFEWRLHLTNGDWIGYLVCMAALTLLQAIFLFPVRRPSPVGRGGSLKVSLAIAALLSVLLAAALVGLLVDMVTLLEIELPSVPGAEWWVCGAVITAWIPTTLMLWSFVRRDQRETVLARVSSRLFLGTIVEAAASVPIAVMIRRKTDCYCGTGSFLALVVCAGVGLFSLGPAIFLPMLAKRRQRWYGGRCGSCGYDMRGCPDAQRCPECGVGWAPQAGERS